MPIILTWIFPVSSHFLGFGYKYFLQNSFLKNPEFNFFLGWETSVTDLKKLYKIMFYAFSYFNIQLFLEETEK